MTIATKTRKQFKVAKITGKKFTEKFYDEPFEVMGSDGDLYDPRSIRNMDYNNNPYDVEVSF